MKLLFLLILLFILYINRFSIIKFIFRLILGKVESKANYQQSRQQQDKRENTRTKYDSPKIFSREEGEYVDYEEV